MDKPTFDRLAQQYRLALKCNFWDTWGIVVSPNTYAKLRIECMQDIVAHRIDGLGTIDELFGLKIIPMNIDDDQAYIVDASLGKMLLEAKGEMQCR